MAAFRLSPSVDNLSVLVETLHPFVLLALVPVVSPVRDTVVPELKAVAVPAFPVILIPQVPDAPVPVFVTV